MKKKAQISNATPSQIFAESVSNVPHAVLLELPKEEHVKRTIRNHRGYNDPSKPASRKELVIEGDWCLYGEKRFLLNDNGPDANERVLIFATDSGLSLLASSNTWFIDGNFGLAPEYFN
ncbi:unnamed protein product [Macrosiphum euphorbiae]|uniref:Uncharacterized protein n=1 Tax=Macrosiphum euphorbiae TaxID=13131 RepID=A0AAV0WBX0_9HEMI|nr:unnamed protein product [Macrosiphum euphorbiae]